MADSSNVPRITSHLRSISLPSKSHPLEANVEDVLRRLSASQAGPSSSLCDIKRLYEAINSMINCPRNQQVLSHEPHRHGVEEVLEGSLGLLDACESTMGIISYMKEGILELQSSLRRRSDGDSGMEKGIAAYLISRKKINKMISKCLKTLHKVDLEKEANLVPAVRTLKEAEAISLSTLKSILDHLSGSNAKGKRQSLVSRLVHSKRVSSEKKVDNNDIENIDKVLFALEAKKLMADTNTVQNLLKQLQASELFIQELQECLESVSRCLLKTRVSLLNVLNH